MSRADIVYNKLVEDIVENGLCGVSKVPKTTWKDKEPTSTKYLTNVQMKFNNEKELPILTSKKIMQKELIVKMFWIWKYKSSCVELLAEKFKSNTCGWQLGNKYRKVKITEELLEMFYAGELSDNYKKTYDGHILLDQVDYLIYTLKTNPNVSVVKTTLWDIEDLDEMDLEHCVHEANWQVCDRKLNLTVNVLSHDVVLESPNDMYMYAVLHRMIAHVTDLEVGEMCFNIDKAQIHDNHISGIQKQIDKTLYSAPKLWLNPHVHSFYDFTPEDILLVGYVYGKTIKTEDVISY